MRIKFTWFDFMIFGILIVVVIAGLMFLKGRQVVPNQEILYTIEIRNTRLGFEDLVIGAEVWDSVRGLPAGQVYEVDVQPAMVWLYDDTVQKYVQNFSESAFDVFVTFKAAAQVYNFVDLEGFRPQVGHRISVEGKGFSVGGYIVGLQLGSE